MSEILRPRRSALYIPGANPRALEKAKNLPADVLILDLEDAVAPDAKIEARERVVRAAASGAYGHREVTIRVNGRDTAWHGDDLRAAAEAGPAAVVVPKVNSTDDVRAIEQGLEKAGAREEVRIWAMLETPTALLRADAIATCSDRLAVLVLGTNDLTNELRAEHVPGRQPLLYALSACLVAARVGGKVILDGVYNDIQDGTGFEAECLQSRQLGFDGKTVIHPQQLAPCNRIFAPSEDEVARARTIIGAFEAAQAEGSGVTTVEGRMIENLHVESARRTLMLAEAIAALDALR